jgi:hypothetical protein
LSFGLGAACIFHLDTTLTGSTSLPCSLIAFTVSLFAASRFSGIALASFAMRWSTATSFSDSRLSLQRLRVIDLLNLPVGDAGEPVRGRGAVVRCTSKVMVMDRSVSAILNAVICSETGSALNAFALTI